MNYILGILLYLGIPLVILGCSVALALWAAQGWVIGTLIVILGLVIAGGFCVAAFEECWFERLTQQLKGG